MLLKYSNCSVFSSASTVSEETVEISLNVVVAFKCKSGFTVVSSTYLRDQSLHSITKIKKKMILCSEIRALFNRD